jgi:MoaA/NifB/PqqE/SkfB family radical SAM enzyme
MVKGQYNKVTKEDGSSYTCRDNFVEDSWNSEYMKKLRLDMIQGTPITGCDVCYKQEANGRISNREHSLREWNWRLGKNTLEDIIKNAEDNEGKIDTPPVYLDLRLGNLCNLKCRMCNPWNSSQIAKEHLELVPKNPEYANTWRRVFGTFPQTIMEDQQWFDHDIMWDQVISLIPTLKKVYMTGGEPTLIKNNFKFMEECIRQGRKDIVLFFNTNCTNVNRKFLDLIRQFDTVNINASLDGTGIVNNYIRAPSDWAQISTNIERLAELPNVNLGITPTIQIYNMFNVVNIIKWVEGIRKRYNKSVFIDFLINNHPHHLNTNIVPQSLRDIAVTEIVEFKNNEMSTHERMTVDSLNGLIGHLRSAQSPDSDTQMNHFKIYTRALDEERGQSLNNIDPRLGALL